MEKAQRQISLAPDFANLSVLEDFVGHCAFLETEESLRVLLIVTEFFQNIVSYSKSLIPSRVLVRIVKDDSVTIVIRYATCNFSELIRASSSTTPHFDDGSSRYRGLGLRMCQNLSSSIQYKKGLFKSSVIIIL